MVEKDKKINEDDLMMLALDNGAADFSASEEGYEILTAPGDFSAVREAVEVAKIEPVSAEVTMIPQTTVVLNDEEDVKKMERILDFLEDDEDVQNVYHNWENENDSEEE
jgi:transcriptional/translational regulatory protein YebC/TACO1